MSILLEFHMVSFLSLGWVEEHKPVREIMSMNNRSILWDERIWLVVSAFIIFFVMAIFY